MNIVAKSDLNFQGKALVPVSNITGIWLTSSDLAKALQYSNSRAVTMIYNKYADEFTNGMTQVLEVSTSGNYRKKLRVFSLRGAHLIAMFARTPVAKEFRRWVLDILDREVQHSPIVKQLTDQELCDLAWLWRAGAVMNEACREIYPLLRVAEHREAGRFYSIGQEYPRTLNKAREILKRETAHIEFQPRRDDNWSRVLPHLRQEVLQ
ncbi:P22AR C-terminal domain-containing protein [uncultured Enterobacter sp.]|uniref:P22AR C-terminal domain-containing protein n=1 Tax=uncultured Enterobacter sp. TaxID=238202 RepID=UPI0033904DEB